jgi:integrase
MTAKGFIPMSMKLTTTIARNLELPSGKTDHIEWDKDFPGFGIRLRVGRNRISRKWIYQYDIAGRTRRITLGNVNAIGIDDARKTAGQLQGKVRLGDDPVGEKAESQARAATTCGIVMKNYLDVVKPRIRPLSWNTREYRFRAFCQLLHPLPITTITRREVAAVLTPISARGRLRLYNNVRRDLRTFFNWAVGQGLIEHNPTTGIPKLKLKDRARVLSMPELVAIWHAAGDINIDFSAPVRLLMLTGQRRSEIGNLCWSEVREEAFIDDGVTITGPAIVLAAERVKNGIKHIVPLSKPAQAILLTHPHYPDDKFMFRPKINARPGRSWSSWGGRWSRCRKALDHALTKRGHTLAPWVVHDLRRSVATHMGEMGIQPHVIEAVLNHMSGSKAGVAGVYNKSRLEEPKRKALVAWAELLMAHVEGRVPADKVVPLRA